MTIFVIFRQQISVSCIFIYSWTLIHHGAVIANGLLSPIAFFCSQEEMGRVPARPLVVANVTVHTAAYIYITFKKLLKWLYWTIACTDTRPIYTMYAWVARQVTEVWGCFNRKLLQLEFYEDETCVISDWRTKLFEPTNCNRTSNGWCLLARTSSPPEI